jgi:hypothetical protein
MENKKILLNAIETPDGTIIISRHRHDFVSHIDANGQYYAVDGGNEYLRRVFDTDDFKDVSVYDDGSHRTRRTNLVWGVNYDKDMNRLPDTDYRYIKDLSTDHIEAILDGGFCRNEFYKEVFNDELNYRK